MRCSLRSYSLWGSDAHRGEGIGRIAAVARTWGVVRRQVLPDERGIALLQAAFALFTQSTTERIELIDHASGRQTMEATGVSHLSGSSSGRGERHTIPLAAIPIFMEGCTWSLFPDLGMSRRPAEIWVLCRPDHQRISITHDGRSEVW